MKIQTNLKNLKKYKIYLKVEEAVNEFLGKKRYLKVDLPVLSPALIPESYLKVFETEFNYLNNKERLFLTPSPELFLKRLLVGGIGNCYYLGKAFRNSEPNSDLHSFEFTMLEYYKVKANYMDLAEELLEMLRFMNKNVKFQMPNAKSRSKISNLNENEIVYQNYKISLNRWEKITVIDAFKKYAGISKKELFDHKLFLKKAKEKNYRVDSFTYKDIFSQIYAQEIEPHLGMNGYPTLIYDYPKEFAALAKLNEDGKTAQRFEFYIAGIELGDCYSELTDWREQERRFEKENVAHQIDKGFIEALKYGLVDCAGIAIGFERLTMIFANVQSINQLKLIEIK